MNREFVLDASVLLAMLHDEPGGGVIIPLLMRCVMSAVNWAEVVQKSLARGVNVAGMRDDVTSLGLTIAVFSAEDGEVAAQLWLETRSHGLSLGDRACLALALRLKLPALTTDRAWAGLKLPTKVRVIR